MIQLLISLIKISKVCIVSNLQLQVLHKMGILHAYAEIIITWIR